MFKFFNRKKKGQSTLEYAVLVMIIIGALIAIQTYIKRGVQGRMKSSADDIGDQFSPGNTNALKSTRVHSKSSQLFGQTINGAPAQGQGTDVMLEPETTNVVENQSIINVQQEFWGTP